LIVLGLGIAYFYTNTKKLENNLIQTKLINNQLNENSKNLLKQSIPIHLNYNQRTNELFTVFTGNTEPHTCVWTIWGDHGSDSVVITKIGGIQTYNMDSYDYVGHLLSNGIKIIKDNKFLPPRLPIYVNCVDWENNNYYGSIGEY